MNVQLPYLNIARIVIQTRSPLSVASGRNSLLYDTAIVRDANALPAIPGSSLAGVLRHLYADLYGEEGNLFGQVVQNRPEADMGSRLHVSWGCVHDSRNRPVEGVLLGEEGRERLRDPLLSTLLAEAPVLRRRVRMNDKGAADSEQKGLFDRSAVPAGCRFSFELSLWSDQANDPCWEKLRNLFAHPAMRLGGATRSGMGNVECVQWHESRFDLQQQRDYRAFSALSLLLGNDQGMMSVAPPEMMSVVGFRAISIRLKPDAGWRIGGTADAPLRQSGGKEPDDIPHHEQIIQWQEDRASVLPRIAVAPASSIKGALAHRVAFHGNCLQSRWENEALVGEESPEVNSLFGYASNDDEGMPGRVLIDDAFLLPDDNELQTHWQMHNSLDRFTGGARNHVLFGEEVLWQESFELRLLIDERDLDANAAKAFELALDDLKEGRLALGGGVARGHGWFNGEEVQDAE